MPFNPTPPSKSNKAPLTPSERSRQVAWGSGLTNSNSAARNQKSRELGLGTGVARLPPYYGWQKMMLMRNPNYPVRYHGCQPVQVPVEVRVERRPGASGSGAATRRQRGSMDSAMPPPPPRYEGTLASPPPPYPGGPVGGDDVPIPPGAVTERGGSKGPDAPSQKVESKGDTGADQGSSNWRRSIGRAFPRRKSSDGDGVIR